MVLLIYLLEKYLSLRLIRTSWVALARHQVVLGSASLLYFLLSFKRNMEFHRCIVHCVSYFPRLSSILYISTSTYFLVASTNRSPSYVFQAASLQMIVCSSCREGVQQIISKQMYTQICLQLSGSSKVSFFRQFQSTNFPTPIVYLFKLNDLPNLSWQ